MVSTDSQRQTEMGGFDSHITEKTIEKEEFMFADVESLLIEQEVMYKKRHTGSKYTTTVVDYIYKDHTYITHIRNAPKLLLCLDVQTKSHPIYVKLKPEDYLSYVEMTEVGQIPPFEKEKVKVKIEDDVCTLKSIGERDICSKPQQSVHFNKHLTYTSSNYRYTYSWKCGYEITQAIRKEWAKRNDCFEGIWTITEVEDPTETKQATLHLESNDDLPNKTTFCLTASEDDTLQQFITEVGDGLISNTELEEVYLTFKHLDSMDMVAENNIGLKLYQSKPSTTETIITKMKQKSPF